MNSLPKVDVNLFVYNGERTIGTAIESILAQSWPNLGVTIIDDGSTDGTKNIIASFIQRYPYIQTKRIRTNAGAVAGFQAAFGHGDADFVMPKSTDDLLAPDFVEKTMSVMLAYPDTAMCHAAGLAFSDQADVRALYPSAHCLQATGADPVKRARDVMERYTSSPSFWGVFRRDAVDCLARIRYRAGWDHALLAELALYGEIRHVAEPLYWRRDGGKPVLQLARAATERGGRRLDIDDPITEPHWCMPLTTTVLAHLETFAVARVIPEQREVLWRAATDVLRARWLPAMRREAATLRGMIPAILESAAAGSSHGRAWMLRNLIDLLQAAQLVLPEEDFAASIRNIERFRSGDCRSGDCRVVEAA